MKLLLDESIPVRLADHFPTDFSVSTVAGMGWAGTKNGALLARTTAEGFHSFITADKGIEHQQNLSSLKILIVVLVARSNRLQELAPLVPQVIQLLRQKPNPRVYRVSA